MKFIRAALGVSLLLHKKFDDDLDVSFAILATNEIFVSRIRLSYLFSSSLSNKHLSMLNLSLSISFSASFVLSSFLYSRPFLSLHTHTPLTYLFSLNICLTGSSLEFKDESFQFFVFQDFMLFYTTSVANSLNWSLMDRMKPDADLLQLLSFLGRRIAAAIYLFS